MTDQPTDPPRAQAKPAPTPEVRARIRTEIRALMADTGLAEQVATRLDAVLARDGPSAVPKWVAEFLKCEAGALAHVLPRRPHLPHTRWRMFHGL